MLASRVEVANGRCDVRSENSMPISEGGSSNSSYPKMFWGGGLGWQVRDYRGRKQVLHPGSAGSVVVLMPEERLGVVVLSNRAGLGLPVMVAYELVDRYLGLQPTATIDNWIAEVVTKPQEAEDERWHRFEADTKIGNFAVTATRRICWRLCVRSLWYRDRAARGRWLGAGVGAELPYSARPLARRRVSRKVSHAMADGMAGQVLGNQRWTGWAI